MLTLLSTDKRGRLPGSQLITASDYLSSSPSSHFLFPSKPGDWWHSISVTGFKRKLLRGEINTRLFSGCCHGLKTRSTQYNYGVFFSHSIPSPNWTVRTRISVGSFGRWSLFPRFSAVLHLYALGSSQRTMYWRSKN